VSKKKREKEVITKCMIIKEAYSMCVLGGEGGGTHTLSLALLHTYTNPCLDLHSKDQQELTSKLIVKPIASQLNWGCPQSPI